MQGGSTITQQVAKNLFLTNARTFRRKVQELLLTLWLEHSFTKQEILEIWLNRVYLGSGAWGVDAAAQHVFRRLGAPAEPVAGGGDRRAAAGAVALQPARRSRRPRRRAAREVLAAMVADRRDHRRGRRRRAAAQIAFPPRAGPAAGWFADWAAEQAQPLLPPDADAVLRTTLDRAAAGGGGGAAGGAARRAGRGGGRGPGRGGGAGRGHRRGAGDGRRAGLSARAPTTARCWRGGSRGRRSSRSSGWPRWRRVHGRTTRCSMRRSASATGARRISSPAIAGEVTLEEALAQSINTAAVRLLLQAGGPRVVAGGGARLGIADTLPNNASLALGTGEVGLLELAAAYAAFFNGGLRGDADRDRRGAGRRPRDRRAARAGAAVIDPDLAAMMVRMMAAVVARGTGRAAAVAGRTVAGKTGTTQDYRDAWFIGWTERRRSSASGWATTTTRRCTA